jgi:hypothetical protein
LGPDAHLHLVIAAAAITVAPEDQAPAATADGSVG